MSPDKSVYSASPSVIPPSLPANETVDLELEQLNQSHGVFSENLCKLISCGNPSTESAAIEQEVSRDHTCNRATTLLGDKIDTDYARCNDRYGIHEHLLFDILLWLPVISLLRFKTMCKSWCALIDSSTFITQHFSHNRNNGRLLGRCGTPPDYDYKFSLLSSSKYEVCSILDHKEHWCSFGESENLITNSCNGIVFLTRNISDCESNSAALWNPATKQLRPVLYRPSDYGEAASGLGFDIRSRDIKFLLSLDYWEAASGLGFDVSSKDYKVISIILDVKNPHKNLVEIYSLRTDSWRTIHKNDVLPFRYIDTWKPVCKEGKCLWVGIDAAYFPILISFDWSDETFETMPLPKEPRFKAYKDSYDKRYQNLDFFGDKLAYIKGVDLGMFDCNYIYFEIWVLDENDGKESWNKICKIGPTGDIDMESLYPIRFSKNGDVLLLGHSLHIDIRASCNFDDIREEEYVQAKELNYRFQDYVHYNESLVSLKRENGA